MIAANQKADSEVTTGDFVAEAAGAVQCARKRRERLVLLAGFGSQAKTAAVQEVARRIGAPIVNVNLELSRRLLDLPAADRPRKIGGLLDELLAKAGADVVVLDRLELLFDATLRQNPLRLLKDLSRQRTVVAAWDGFIDDGHVRYAEPGHPEHRRDAIDGVQVIQAPAAPAAARSAPVVRAPAVRAEGAAP